MMATNPVKISSLLPGLQVEMHQDSASVRLCLLCVHYIVCYVMKSIKKIHAFNQNVKLYL